MSHLFFQRRGLDGGEQLQQIPQTGILWSASGSSPSEARAMASAPREFNLEVMVARDASVRPMTMKVILLAGASGAALLEAGVED
jgi:hypothetical protein